MGTTSTVSMSATGTAIPSRARWFSSATIRPAPSSPPARTVRRSLPSMSRGPMKFICSTFRKAIRWIRIPITRWPSIPMCTSSSIRPNEQRLPTLTTPLAAPHLQDLYALRTRRSFHVQSMLL